MQNHAHDRLTSEHFLRAGSLSRTGASSNDWEFTTLPRMRFPSPDPVTNALRRRRLGEVPQPSRKIFSSFFKHIQKHLHAFLG